MLILIARITGDVKKELFFWQVFFLDQLSDMLHDFIGRLELVTVFQAATHLVVKVMDEAMHIQCAMMDSARLLLTWHIQVELECCFHGYLE